MKISRRHLHRIIREELSRATMRERVNPATFKVTGDKFSVMADPTKEEEGEESEEITGTLVPFKGRHLPKADPESLPFGYSSTRSVSGQLSSQLRDVIDDLLGAAPDISPDQRASKGRVIADALADLARKYPDDEDVIAAIDAILGVKMGFDVPYGDEGGEL